MSEPPKDGFDSAMKRLRQALLEAAFFANQQDDAEPRMEVRRIWRAVMGYSPEFEPVTFTCEWCGKPFKRQPRVCNRPRFCSHKCRSGPFSARRRSKTTWFRAYRYLCEHPGKWFTLRQVLDAIKIRDPHGLESPTQERSQFQLTYQSFMLLGKDLHIRRKNRPSSVGPGHHVWWCVSLPNRKALADVARMEDKP